MVSYIKVMLVDDEVIALNSLRNLINWNELGYKLVATENNPLKALDVFLELKPQIMFIDIKMPVMDGIELSEKILSSGIPVKIVILTAYKNFHYARNSIRIGVSDYIVKHELDEEKLIDELNKLRIRIFNEEKKDKNSRIREMQNIINGIIVNDNISDNLTSTKGPIAYQSILLLFCKIDKPFKIFENIEKKKNEMDSLLTRVLGNIDLGENNDIVNLKRDESVIIVYLDIDEQDDYYDADKIAEKIFSRIKTSIIRFEETVSAYQIIEKKENILGIYDQFVNISGYSIFNGRGKLVKFNRENIPETSDNDFPDAEYHELRKNITNFDIEGAKEVLLQIFGKIQKDYKNPDIVRKVSDSLIKILGEVFKEHQIINPFDNEGGRIMMSRSNNLYVISEIRDWFLDVTEFALKMIENKKSDKYSIKVQETLIYIHKRYMENWSVEDIALQLRISEVYLRRIFKSETGTTIINYLNELRIERAIEMMESGDYKIFEIAEKVGYSSSQYFIKVFRKYIGVSPLAYISGE